MKSYVFKVLWYEFIVFFPVEPFLWQYLLFLVGTAEFWMLGVDFFDFFLYVRFLSFFLDLSAFVLYLCHQLKLLWILKHFKAFLIWFPTEGFESSLLNYCIDLLYRQDILKIFGVDFRDVLCWFIVFYEIKLFELFYGLFFKSLIFLIGTYKLLLVCFIFHRSFSGRI